MIIYVRFIGMIYKQKNSRKAIIIRCQFYNFRKRSFTNPENKKKYLSEQVQIKGFQIVDNSKLCKKVTNDCVKRLPMTV